MLHCSSTKAGNSTMISGPGLMPWMNIAARRTAAGAEPGTASVSTGMMAPGTAAMASAAAYIAAVQSQAHMQKMIAGQLRQEAARLAHDTMMLKRGAVFTRESRNKATELNR